MQGHDLQHILGKAAVESEFRTKLLENPEECLSGFDLSDEEKEALMNLDSDKLTAFSESLDQRITKGFGSAG